MSKDDPDESKLRVLQCLRKAPLRLSEHDAVVKPKDMVTEVSLLPAENDLRDIKVERVSEADTAEAHQEPEELRDIRIIEGKVWLHENGGRGVRYQDPATYKIKNAKGKEVDWKPSKEEYNLILANAKENEGLLSKAIGFIFNTKLT